MYVPIDRMDKISQNIKEKLPVKAELLRKSAHLISLVLVLLYPRLTTSMLLVLLVPISLILMLLEIFRARSHKFSDTIIARFHYVLRSKEIETSKGPSNVIGSSWACWSFTLLTLWFPLHVAIPCFAMFLWADGTAAIIGKVWGRNYWPKSHKTLEGSLAFLLAGLFMMSFFPKALLGGGFIAVIVAALAEIPEGPLDDNFRVPLIAATTMYLVELWFL